MIYTFMVLAMFGVLAFRAFDRSKASQATSAAHSALHDPVVNYVGGVWDTAPDVVIGGKQVFRPTWGARLLIPGILLALILIVEITDFEAMLSADQVFLSRFLIYLTLFFMFYQWIMLMFVYRVSVDGNSITSHGYSVLPKTRDLRDLTDVQILAKEGLIKFSFKNAKPIYTMRYISQRDTFFAAMHRHIAQNT